MKKADSKAPKGPTLNYRRNTVFTSQTNKYRMKEHMASYKLKGKEKPTIHVVKPVKPKQKKTAKVGVEGARNLTLHNLL